MIVKNEAEHLEKCLSTARPHVDEIVIVDTGSTDGTRAIARRYADVFDEIEWPDSFSVARNHSFDLASGDYIIWLDGDEHIEDPEDWYAIRADLKSERVAGLKLLVHNLLPEKQLLSGDRLRMIRVVPNHPMVRFVGRVHNQIHESLSSYCERFRQVVVDAGAEVEHVGYVLEAGESKQKYNPRLALLQHEIEQAVNPAMRAYYQYQLGVGYFMVQAHEEADSVLRNIDFGSLDKRHRYYTHYLAGDAAYRCDDYRRALHHATVIMDMKPEEPLGYALAGKVLQADGDIKDALLLFEAALKRSRQRDENVRFILSETVLHGQITMLALKIGLLKRAYDHCQAYLEALPEDKKAQRILHKIETVLAEGTTA
jgi:glycosyltransferase involved in cell wall biosynthesis